MKNMIKLQHNSTITSIFTGKNKTLKITVYELINIIVIAKPSFSYCNDISFV